MRALQLAAGITTPSPRPCSASSFAGLTRQAAHWRLLLDLVVRAGLTLPARAALLDQRKDQQSATNAAAPTTSAPAKKPCARRISTNRIGASAPA